MRAIRVEFRRVRQPIETTQWALLKRIKDGPCTISDLARHNQTSLPTISKSVDMLVRRDLVERWVDKSDRRQTLVRLTPGGRRQLRECRRVSERALAAKLATLTSAERARLVTSLDLLTHVLRSDDGDNR